MFKGFNLSGSPGLKTGTGNGSTTKKTNCCIQLQTFSYICLRWKWNKWISDTSSWHFGGIFKRLFLVIWEKMVVHNVVLFGFGCEYSIIQRWYFLTVVMWVYLPKSNKQTNNISNKCFMFLKCICVWVWCFTSSSTYNQCFHRKLSPDSGQPNNSYKAF